MKQGGRLSGSEITKDLFPVFGTEGMSDSAIVSSCWTLCIMIPCAVCTDPLPERSLTYWSKSKSLWKSEGPEGLRKTCGVRTLEASSYSAVARAVSNSREKE